MTLETVGAWFHGRHEHSRRRQRVITANAELQERELVKLDALRTVTANALTTTPASLSSRRDRRQPSGSSTVARP